MEKIFSIAIDGPAGAGKSTVAHALAKILHAMYLDTGAMYRALGLYYVRMNRLRDTQYIAETVSNVDLRVRYVDGAQHIYLADEDVGEKIRTPECSMAASAVSAIREVRLAMVRLQQEIAQGTSVVMDGRDIGTVVLPNATVKLYITASAAVRAERRYIELREKGKEVVYHEVLDDMVERDYNDTHRRESPLRRAEDAVLLDTSNLTYEEVVCKAWQICRERIGG